MSIMIAPLPPAARALAELPRHKLEMLAEVIVAILDATDPDPDREFDAEEACDAGDDLMRGECDGDAGDPEDEEDSGDREPDDPREDDDPNHCEAGDDRGTGHRAFDPVVVAFRRL